MMAFDGRKVQLLICCSPGPENVRESSFTLQDLSMVLKNPEAFLVFYWSILTHIFFGALSAFRILKIYYEAFKKRMS